MRHLGKEQETPFLRGSQVFQGRGDTVTEICIREGVEIWEPSKGYSARTPMVGLLIGVRNPDRGMHEPRGLVHALVRGQHTITVLIRSVLGCCKQQYENNADYAAACLSREPVHRSPSHTVRSQLIDS